MFLKWMEALRVSVFKFPLGKSRLWSMAALHRITYLKVKLTNVGSAV